MHDQPECPAPASGDQASAPRFRLIEGAGLFARGLAMGAADIVPGVSGGTIAFITGIYERFVDALRSLSPRFLLTALRRRPGASARQLAEIHWAVLIPLFAGIAVAVATMSGVISGLMEDHPGPTYAFFFGLIIATVWIPFARMTRRTAKHFLALILFAVGAFLFVGLQPGGLDLRVARSDPGAETVFYAGKIRHPADLASIRRAGAAALGESPAVIVAFDPKGILGASGRSSGDGAVDAALRIIATDQALDEWLADPPALVVLEESRGSLVWIFACGVIAISAMILPGLSGSFLLLFLGQYHAVLSAIRGSINEALAMLGREPTPMDALVERPWWTDPMFLGVFLVGVVIGLGVFSHIVGWLFDHRHDITMAALTGLLIGALRQPGSVVLEQADVAAGLGQTGGYWMAVTIAGVAGAAIVTLLGYLDARLRARRSGAVEAN